MPTLASKLKKFSFVDGQIVSVHSLSSV